MKVTSFSFLISQKHDHMTYNDFVFVLTRYALVQNVMLNDVGACVYVLFMFVSICIEKCLEYKSNLKGTFSVYHYYMVWMRYAAGAMGFFIL